MDRSGFDRQEKNQRNFGPGGILHGGPGLIVHFTAHLTEDECGVRKRSVLYNPRTGNAG